jgi:tocopherol O-methyltransferase
LRLATPEHYQALIKQTGFGDIEYEDVSDQVKKTWTLCLKRVAWKLLSDRKYMAFILSSSSKNKSFLQSLARIRLAYETGSMTYGIFKATKEA